MSHIVGARAKVRAVQLRLALLLERRHLLVGLVHTLERVRLRHGMLINQIHQRRPLPQQRPQPPRLLHDPLVLIQARQLLAIEIMRRVRRLRAARQRAAALSKQKGPSTLDQSESAALVQEG